MSLVRTKRQVGGRTYLCLGSNGVRHMTASENRVLQYLLALVALLFVTGNCQSWGIIEAPTATDWIPVPPWLAGTWRAESETLIYSYDYRLARNAIEQPVTIKIERMSTIGTQQDSTGQIWHYIGAPYERVIDTMDYVERQQIEHISIIENLDNKVSTRSIAAVSRTAKADNREIDAFREETTTTYTPLADGVIETQFDIRDFDFDGSLTRSSRSFCTESRVEPFKNTDRDQRGDLRSMFKQFMAQKGKPAG